MELLKFLESLRTYERCSFFVTSSFLFLVRPGAPSSVLAHMLLFFLILRFQIGPDLRFVRGLLVGRTQSPSVELANV